MKHAIILIIQFLCTLIINAQDLTLGLAVNDMSAHPMQNITKPGYLSTITDPSFGTTIRRITDAGAGNAIVPMYSTIQAWNADESLMIVYDVTHGDHKLLNGMNYQFIRNLDDVYPDDIEQIFWDFNDPDVFYFPDHNTEYFIRYTVSTQNKEIITNPDSLVGCSGTVFMGDDIQMMSWDSDVLTFRCGNSTAYAYRISTGQVITFDISEIDKYAPEVAPSGILFHHDDRVFNTTGNSSTSLNLSYIEHSCTGKLTNGHDAYFAVAFEEGPEGGCLGNIIAHDLTTGDCFPIISEDQGYPYPKSGTHISALAHKNTEGGWLASSMIGYEEDGQTLLDQELVIAKADQGNVKVCRIGHHRSDENDFDYWGEPHACISPTGTRVLFGSDWSGSEDGQSLDCYVVELPSFNGSMVIRESNTMEESIGIYPNPVTAISVLDFFNPDHLNHTLQIYNGKGSLIQKKENIRTNQIEINKESFPSGIYFFKLSDFNGSEFNGKFIIN